ncbi:MAG: c-type cytochrome [Flavobacteriales bacterium]
MRSRRMKWFITIGVILVIASCAKDEGPVPMPRPVSPVAPIDTTTDTTIITIDTAYFTEVAAIFHAKCWLCHPPYGGMDLIPSEAYVNLVNVTSTNYAPEKRVVPGNLDASVLWHKVSGDGIYGTMMPPPGYTQLTLEELQTIQDWIDQGALNN